MLQMPTKTFEVDGVTYRTTLLDAHAARGMYLQLVQTLGPALESLGATDDGPADLALVRMISAVVKGLSPEFLNQMCDRFGEKTVIPRTGGEDTLMPAFFGVHFAGRYSAMSRWLVECIKANGMIDFLSGILHAPASTVPSAPPV
jgi:hypothetical protein